LFQEQFASIFQKINRVLLQFGSSTGRPSCLASSANLILI
jgi:hypothetical protein